MSKRKKTTTTPHQLQTYVVILHYRTAEDFTDSYGDVTPAGTMCKTFDIVMGEEGIAKTINNRMSIEDCILDKVNIIPFTLKAPGDVEIIQ